MGNPNRILPILTPVDQRPGASLTSDVSDTWYGKIFSGGRLSITSRSCPLCRPRPLLHRHPRTSPPNASDRPSWGTKSLQGRPRFGRSSADWDTAAVLIDTSSHMPSIVGRPVAPQVGVLWGMILLALLPKPLYQQFCGQGQGRTADLPIFRSWDNSSPKTVSVRDLRQNIDTNTDERRRT